MRTITWFFGDIRISLAVACFAFVASSPTSADEDTIVRLQLKPTGEPDPPLKHHLLPEFRDLIPGNAAVWYGKVFAEQQATVSNREFWGSYDEFMSVPLEELRDNTMVRGFTKSRLLFGYLEKAGRAQSCDWQLRVREESYYELLLPEVQQTRSFARLLSLRARHQLSEGDIEGAIKTLQSGFALAHHVACGETVVNALVGAAIHRVMTDRVMELIQQPGAPNLYWALTSLPRPAIDFRPALAGELSSLSMSFPVFDQLQNEQLSDDYWNEKLREFWAATQKQSINPRNLLDPLELQVLRAYPVAKERLIAGGFDPAQVDDMPVSRAILLQSFIEYEQQRQSRYKWANLPYPEAIKRLGNEKQIEAEASDVLPLPKIFSTSVGGILKGQAITQLYVDLLITVEAIRLHAAAHDGELPESLADITAVPVPNDPMTGKPFPYQLTDEGAVLTPAAMDWTPNQFEITLLTKDSDQ